VCSYRSPESRRKQGRVNSVPGDITGPHCHLGTPVFPGLQFAALYKNCCSHSRIVQSDCSAAQKHSLKWLFCQYDNAIENLSLIKLFISILTGIIVPLCNGKLY
jgi:hypothetical protein